MANWKRLAVDGVTGVVLGAGDFAVQHEDNKRDVAYTTAAATAGKHLPLMKQYGTYYDFGLPILTIGVVAAADAMHRPLPDEWSSRLITGMGSLVGRKGAAVAYDMVKNQSSEISNWHKVNYGGDIAAAAAQAAQAAREKAANNLQPSQRVGTRGSL